MMTTITINIDSDSKDYEGLIAFLDLCRFEYSTQPILNQTSCSTLREVLVQKLNNEMYMLGCACTENKKANYEGRAKATSEILKLIDILLPVS